MQAILQILTGPETGRKIHLKSGQMARFGRTEWCDFAFPYDLQLADVHFSIETGVNTVTLADLSSGNGLLVDGKIVTTCSLKSGQKFKAGNMVFAVTTELLFETSGAGPVSVNQQKPGAPPPAELASPICESIELSEAAKGLLDDTIEILPFIDKLTGEKLLKDAMCVLANWFSKQKAVWWAAGCVESACSIRIQSQARLIGIARTWVQNPTEENRRVVAQAAESDNSNLPACWLARAAGWSGGSLTPPDLPVVPPADHLTVQAVMVALSLAAVFIDPAKTSTNYLAFIKQGKELSQKKFDWEITDRQD